MPSWTTPFVSRARRPSPTSRSPSTSHPASPTSSRPTPRSSTKRPPRWTGPGNSCRRGSQAQTASPHRRREEIPMTATSREPIAVIGATGLQGGATARALLDAHAPVRALVRRTDSDAARALAELGADVVVADLDDFDGLRAAFTDVGGLFAMTTPGIDRSVDREVKHGRAIADAAAAAGVPHVVYSSVGGAERHTGIPHFDSKREIEEYLVARGLPTTFVRPVFFMDNFAQFITPSMEDGTLVVRLPLPPGIPLQMIAAEDVGAVAAAAALDPDRVAGG